MNESLAQAVARKASAVTGRYDLRIEHYEPSRVYLRGTGGQHVAIVAYEKGRANLVGVYRREHDGRETELAKLISPVEIR